MVKSKAKKVIRVGIKFKVADDETKNVDFPITEMKENLFSQEAKQILVFTKIDPSKENWGDISIELNVKEGKTSQISTGTTYMTGQYQGGGYSGGGIGVGTGVDYTYYGGNDMGI